MQASDMTPSRHDRDSGKVNGKDVLLWLLSDSNLPTGGFVASSGLEAYYVHGFLHHASPRPDKRGAQSSTDRIAAATVDFLRASLTSYASSALPFLLDAHRRVTAWSRGLSQDGEKVNCNDRTEAHDGVDCLDSCLQDLTDLDEAYQSFALNHVLRRASKAQGMALLTLYSKSFARSSLGQRGSCADDDPEAVSSEQAQPCDRLIEGLRKRVRFAAAQGRAPHAHLPVCWGVLTAALSVEAQDAVSLHLFLQARAIISSSIRLNTVGPYMAHSILMFEVRTIVAEVLGQVPWVRDATASPLRHPDRGPAALEGPTAGAPPGGLPCREENDFDRDWNWDDDGAWSAEERHSWQENIRSPVNQWPLGEIIQARHDVLHSRLFNS
ncbi:unnamed protein product [Parajaminaea phylloscopi]